MNRRSLFRRLLLAPVAVALGPLLAQAKPKRPRRDRQKRYWRGGVGDWESPDNWSPRGVPGPNDDVFVLGGKVAVHSAAPCHSLVLGGAKFTHLGQGECHVGHLVILDEPGTGFFWRHS